MLKSVRLCRSPSSAFSHSVRLTLPDFDAWRARHPVAAAELDALLTPVAPAESGGSEARVQSLVRLAAAADRHCLHRNNRGAMIAENGQLVRFGLAHEAATSKVFRSSDLIGITTITVQPHHVGKRHGIFTACEIKKPGWKKPTDERERGQMNFLMDVARRAGIAGFVTSEADYRRYVDTFVKGV